MISTLMAVVNPGDEVIVFSPFYENYGPDAILSGASPRYVPLREPDWTFDADAQVRTAMTVGRERGSTAPSVFFADVAANIYSLDAGTGQLRWKKKGDDHPVARITGTPKFLDGRLYVPVSSLEELAGADPKYPCCTFRGSVLALDASNGNQHTCHRKETNQYAAGDCPLNSVMQTPDDQEAERQRNCYGREAQEER